MKNRFAFFLVFFGILIFLPGNLYAIDYVTLEIDQEQKKLQGRIIAEDVDGNLVLEERDGQWYKIEKGQIQDRGSDKKPFVPYTSDEMIPLLKAEFPEYFNVHKSGKYLIVYDTSTAYAKWCAVLLEHLQSSFLAQWKKKGLELQEPEFPMVAILFSDRKDFILHTKREVGDIGETIAAYYNFNTNRVVFSDLTGFERQFEGSTRLTQLRIKEFLARSGVEQSISSFVHEATHQVAFNSGMHQRYGSCPLWLSEGIATFYETPDLSSTKGWSTGAKINPVRARDLLDLMSRNPRDIIRKIIQSDDLIRDPEKMHDCYATAWAMVYYLNQKKPKEFVKYLKLISEKRSFDQDSAEQRLKDFESVFGDDWNQFYAGFTKFVRSL